MQKTRTPNTKRAITDSKMRVSINQNILQLVIRTMQVESLAMGEQWLCLIEGRDDVCS